MSVYILVHYKKGNFSVCNIDTKIVFFKRPLSLQGNYTPLPEGGGGGYTVLPLSFHPSKIFFVAFISVAVDGRNLIFGHKRHIGIPYCG